MKLSKPEALWVPYEHGISPRHVQPILDDVGGEQDISIASRKTDNGLVDFCCRHPAMRHLDRQFWNDVLQYGFDTFDVFNTRNDDEALSASAMLPHQTRSHRCAVESSE